MSNEFSKTSDMLETCLSKLDAADEFEFIIRQYQELK